MLKQTDASKALGFSRCYFAVMKRRAKESRDARVMRMLILYMGKGDLVKGFRAYKQAYIDMQWALAEKLEEDQYELWNIAKDICGYKSIDSSRASLNRGLFNSPEKPSIVTFMHFRNILRKLEQDRL